MCTDFMLYVQGMLCIQLYHFESGDIFLCAAGNAALQFAVFAAYCAVIQSVNCNGENELGWYRGYFRPYFCGGVFCLLRGALAACREARGLGRLAGCGTHRKDSRNAGQKNSLYIIYLLIIYFYLWRTSQWKN